VTDATPKEKSGKSGEPDPRKAEAAARKAEKAQAAAKAADAPSKKSDDRPKEPPPPARLRDRYKAEIVPKMRERFGYSSVMAVPKLDKIVISMGLGKVHENKKAIESAAADLAVIAGQRPVMTHSRMAVSNFRLREGVVVGTMVTLRGARMYEFLDRLISVVIPRIRDFRGLKPNAFDEAGNYSMGLTDQIVFPEIRADKVEHFQGMNVTIGIKNGSPESSRELLKLFGMPFRT
jgi:large subunit ribosomal protein L5